MRIGSTQTLVLGPPGCGKTTDLLSRVERALASNIKPNRIAFVSFTKKAVMEATARACEKFNLKPSDFPWFRTIHSLCFSLLGVKREDMMGRANYTELGQQLGYAFEGTFDESETGLPLGMKEGDKLLFLDNFARVTMTPLRETWEIANANCDWFALERLSKTLENYKRANMLYDFTDLLTRVSERNYSIELDLAVVDEAQDLSRLQWSVLQRVLADVPTVFIAGDDDQSIYRWSGADVTTFLELEGKKELLRQSHRLPRAVFTNAQRIISNVRTRYEKPYAPRDLEGLVDVATSLDHVRFNDESTLCLGRNVYLLSRYEAFLRNRGLTYIKRGGVSSVKTAHVQAIIAWEALRKGDAISGRNAKQVYEHLRFDTYLRRGSKASIATVGDKQMLYITDLERDHGLMRNAIWHDALENIEIEQREYYLTVLRAGRKLTAPPKISINTIHGVKGGEADHVVVMADVSPMTFQEYQKDADNEHRVAYVAVTRSRNRLTLVQPTSPYAYPY